MIKVILLFLSLSFGQDIGLSNPDPSKYKRDFEKQIEKQREEMDKMMGSGSFKSMRDQMLKMMEEFHNDPFFNSGRSPFNQSVLSWDEDQKYRILKIKSESKESPLEIKIEKGRVTVKGEIKSTEKVQTPNGTQVFSTTQLINNSVAIPRDVDADKAEFVSKEKEVWIKFPKQISKQDVKIKGPVI